MKTFIALLSTAVIFSSVQAQEPTVSGTGGLPTADPGAPMWNEPIPLIPETPPTIEKSTRPSGSDIPSSLGEADAKIKRAKSSPAADELKERIRFREVKTRALKDPRVEDAFSRAQVAKTDPEKREALKQYYTILYARMLALDKSLKSTISLRKEAAIHRLDQPNVNPSEQAALKRMSDAQ